MAMTHKERAELARKLAKAAGITRHGVYKCWREGRVPSNALALRGWNRVMARQSKAAS